MKLETLAIHAGRSTDPTTGAVTAPLHMSTTFERAGDGSFPSGFGYIREANPNRNAFETCIASLEGGSAAIAFSSGMAAIAAVIEAHSDLGRPRVILPADIYFGVRSLVAKTDIGRNFDTAIVDLTDLDQLRATLADGGASLVWVETPSNPLITVIDIAAVSEIAHEASALVAVDNTWGTPILQRPFELGADIVIHSATKYVGGHSDMMLGVVVIGSEAVELSAALRAIQNHKGSVPSPFDCWMALRGVQTLPQRMVAHCANAQAIAEALAEHASVETVLYPGLTNDPGHDVAKRQMSGFGGMLSFIVAGGVAAAMEVAGRLQLVTRATSLGGTHTLIEHRASIEGPDSMAPPGLLRMSVGLEHPDDIIADLMNALAA